MQNIGADNAGDAFYRYKMPKLIAKIEGRGNGIKTNIVNNVDIAKALERPPEYVLKYFGCELGAQTNFDKNIGTSIVNGAHDQKKLCELLEGFIKKYVQCYSCGNPETTVKIKKDFIFLKCKACGYVSDVDMRHKLNTFILKNPPENKMSKEEKKLKKAEEERMRDAKAADKKDKEKKKKDKEKKKKKSGDEKGDGEEQPGEEGEAEAAEEEEEQEEEEEVVWMTDTSEEAARKRAAEQLTSATAAMVTVGNIDAEKEAARKKAEKEAKKKAEAEAAEAAAAAEKAAQLSLLEGSDKVEAAAAVEALRSLLPTMQPATLADLMKRMNVEGGPAGKMRALIEALFAGQKALLPGAIKTHAPLLEAVAQDMPSQLAVLVALEWLVTVCEPDRMKEIAAAVKVLFDMELVEDEVITAWYEAPAQGALKLLAAPLEGVKQVRLSCEPVYEWLLEDSDEEDDDEEDDE